MVISSFWAIYKLISMKNLFIQKVITRQIINGPFFSTLAVKDLSKFILKHNRSQRKQMLNLIAKNEFRLLIKQINDSLLKAKINLMIKGKTTKVTKPDNLYQLMEVSLLLDQMNNNKALLLLDKLPKDAKSLPLALRGVYFLNLAQISMSEGDLETSSMKAGAALKIFQKKNMLFEEAKAYLLLGTIYKISGLFDTADLMFRSSLKIFQYIQAPKYEAEVLSSLGMLMSLQERFAEASAFFDQAKKIFSNLKEEENKHFIISQTAMNELLQNNLDNAEELANLSLKKHHSDSGKALASEIIARTSFAKMSWADVIKFAETASNLYLKEHNYAAYFECRYLIAEAKTNLSLDVEAEVILREIIDQEKHHKSCFHVANAYTLLGLILLKQNKLYSAKSIFNQALNRELYNERYKGAAIDYLNLALVEKQCGNMEGYSKNITAALNCVTDMDEDLYKQIKLLQPQNTNRQK